MSKKTTKAATGITSLLILELVGFLENRNTITIKNRKDVMRPPSFHLLSCTRLGLNLSKSLSMMMVRRKRQATTVRIIFIPWFSVG
jgi:hypothetical protein